MSLNHLFATWIDVNGVIEEGTEVWKSQVAGPHWWEDRKGGAIVTDLWPPMTPNNVSSVVYGYSCWSFHTISHFSPVEMSARFSNLKLQGCHSHRIYCHSCDRRSKLWLALFGSLTIDHANFWPLTFDRLDILPAKNSRYLNCNPSPRACMLGNKCSAHV